MAIALTVKGAIRQRRLLYIVLSVLMALIVAVGFWPTYYGPLVRLTLAQAPLIHVHAIVFTGWLALFSTQAVLAANGRLRWHVRLGRIGIAYGVLLVIVGLTTGVLRSAALPREGQAEGLLYVAFVDMLVFASFFAAAVRFRRRPEVHKRLMTVAATALLVAAVGRNPFLPAPPAGLAAMIGPPDYLCSWPNTADHSVSSEPDLNGRKNPPAPGKASSSLVRGECLHRQVPDELGRLRVGQPVTSKKG